MLWNEIERQNNYYVPTNVCAWSTFLSSILYIKKKIRQLPTLCVQWMLIDDRANTLRGIVRPIIKHMCNVRRITNRNTFARRSNRMYGHTFSSLRWRTNTQYLFTNCCKSVHSFYSSSPVETYSHFGVRFFVWFFRSIALFCVIFSRCNSNLFVILLL